MRDLISFVRESNRIEGITPVRQHELLAHEAFLSLDLIRVGDLQGFVRAVASADLRSEKGMDVRVGSHRPPPGGPKVVDALNNLLDHLLEVEPDDGFSYTPFEIHQRYESLHPFIDGNGRSGRVLWAWHRLRLGRDPFVLGFLHSWYYESLEVGRL